MNHISFSPDSRFLASASFDKKIKLWCGKTGVAVVIVDMVFVVVVVVVVVDVVVIVVIVVGR